MKKKNGTLTFRDSRDWCTHNIFVYFPMAKSQLFLIERAKQASKQAHPDVSEILVSSANQEMQSKSFCIRFWLLMHLSKSGKNVNTCWPEEEWPHLHLDLIWSERGVSLIPGSTLVSEALARTRCAVKYNRCLTKYTSSSPKLNLYTSVCDRVSFTQSSLKCCDAVCGKTGSPTINWRSVC